MEGKLLLSPTPFLIGIPSSFLQGKAKNISLDDVWIADLDSAEAQNSAKNAVSTASLNSGGKEGPNADGNVTTFKDVPALDADAVDVLTRVAMLRTPCLITLCIVLQVEFFNSPSLLADFTEHTRTLRLFPNPIVNFQYISFIRSRPSFSQFTQRLAKTQVSLSTSPYPQ
ncbi:unnamed protein product [Schistocephalus solidus]|uniref:UDENN domain-containing protein n=1 Tax=Schistocephalus solidus TaxID=70667 RepID=A0A183T7N8_SCHSO|nr:unnamed protein product [Schistocephalus solidus]